MRLDNFIGCCEWVLARGSDDATNVVCKELVWMLKRIRRVERFDGRFG